MNRPILFMKAGVLRANPPGFYAALSNRYGANLISTDTIRRELNSGDRTHAAALTREVHDRARLKAREALESGENVIYSAFLNQLVRREQVRDEVVAPAGAMSVLLVIHAPMPVIRERVLKRFEKDHPGIPGRRAPEVLGDYAAATNMVRTTEWPQENEAALRLDGTRPIRELLQSISDHLASSEISE